MLVFVYAIGFLIPFLILGLFTSQALNFLKAKRNLIKYTVKIGGAILIIMGIMILTGWMNCISGYLNSSSSKNLNKGKVVFLNFWATWCPPCREEMPDIEELYKKYNFKRMK